MFFVAGSSSQEIDHGPILPLTCPRCNQVTYWRMIQNISKVSVYFIPVANSDNRHKLVCTSCGYFTMLSLEQVQRAHWLKQVTAAFFNKQISDEEYRKNLESVKYLH